MIDEVFEQVVRRMMEYCSKEENQEMIIGPLERFISIRFQWIIRCFEMIACLAIVQTLMLGYVLFKVSLYRNSTT